MLMAWLVGRQITMMRKRPTHEKPIEEAFNADIFYEMDTGKVWLFDAANSKWLEQ